MAAVAQQITAVEDLAAALSGELDGLEQELFGEQPEEGPRTPTGGGGWVGTQAAALTRTEDSLRHARDVLARLKGALEGRR
jgi:hypothetical protein